MNYASSILGLLPGGRRAAGIGQLTTKIEGYLPTDQVERVREAFAYAESAHKGQKRHSGEAYITHPIAVADILADLHLDGATIAAAILHDVVEDTPSSMAEVEQKFGKEVAEIVDGVTKLDQVQFKSRKEAQAESFRKMILAMVRDIRVIMVKLADRTHNMRTLSSMPAEKRRSVARETLDIYGPIANRLGIHSIKLELEELGFRTLYPQRYRVIEREQQARLLDYRVRLSFSSGETVRVLLRGTGKLPDELRLRLIHPTQGRQDHQVQLASREAGIYEGSLNEVNLEGSSKWYFHIEDVASTWRIAGEWIPEYGKHANGD